MLALALALARAAAAAAAAAMLQSLEAVLDEQVESDVEYLHLAFTIEPSAHHCWSCSAFRYWSRAHLRAGVELRAPAAVAGADPRFSTFWRKGLRTTAQLPSSGIRPVSAQASRTIATSPPSHGSPGAHSAKEERPAAGGA